jgi:hypothetical protein
LSLFVTARRDPARAKEDQLRKRDESQKVCAICGKSYAEGELVHGALVRDVIENLILKDHPEWSSEALICRADLARYRAGYVRSILEAEKGELTSLE